MSVYGSGAACSDPALSADSETPGGSRAWRKVGTGKSGSLVTVGAHKSIVGHTGEAGGLVGLVVAVMSLHKGKVPAYPHIATLDPLLLDGAKNVRIPQDSCADLSGAQRRGVYAAVHSYGLGGHVGHAILQRADPSKGSVSANRLQAHHKWPGERMSNFSAAFQFREKKEEGGGGKYSAELCGQDLQKFTLKAVDETVVEEWEDDMLEEDTPAAVYKWQILDEQGDVNSTQQRMDLLDRVHITSVVEKVCKDVLTQAHTESVKELESEGDADTLLDKHMDTLGEVMVCKCPSSLKKIATLQVFYHS